MKRKIAIGLFLLVAGTSAYWLYRTRSIDAPATITPDQAYTNLRWQRDFRPRADRVIKILEDKGLDVSRARLLCDRMILTVPEGSACIDELESLQGYPPAVQPRIQ